MSTHAQTRKHNEIGTIFLTQDGNPKKPIILGQFRVTPLYETFELNLGGLFFRPKNVYWWPYGGIGIDSPRFPCPTENHTCRIDFHTKAATRWWLKRCGLNFDQWHETLSASQASWWAVMDFLGVHRPMARCSPLSRLLGDHIGGILWLVGRGRLDKGF